MTLSGDFMEWVEAHERAWGNTMYPGRPSLDDILNAPCVTFWRPVNSDRHMRYKVKLYTRQRDIENVLLKQIARSHIEQPQERLSRIFIDRQLHRVKAVRILLEPVGTKSRGTL